MHTTLTGGLALVCSGLFVGNLLATDGRLVVAGLQDNFIAPFVFIASGYELWKKSAANLRRIQGSDTNPTCTRL